MSTETKNKIVPKFRFKEFSGSWKKDTLENLIDLQSGYAFQSDFFSSEGMKLLTPKNFTKNGYANFNRENTKYTTEEVDAKYICKEGDLMLLLTDLTPSCELLGKPLFLFKKDGEVLLNQRIVKVISKGSIEIPFLLYFFSTELFHKRIKDTATGSTVRHSSNTIIEDTKIYFPSPEEQQKIADCLSSLDELITAHNQKLEALQSHKKGLMQQLFPAEGETVPKLRFVGYSDEWEEKTLSQVADYENGKAHEQDISAEGDFIVVNSKFISSDGEVKKFTNTPYCLAKKDDILMVLSDVPNGKAIAKCFFVDTDNLYTVNQRICKLTPFDANGYFLFYVLNRNSYFLSFDDGVKQTNLKKEEVLNCPMLLPKDPEEQQKISDCLYSLDELITEQVEKIETLQKHKKGLMQGLFPNINE